MFLKAACRPAVLLAAALVPAAAGAALPPAAQRQAELAAVLEAARERAPTWIVDAIEYVGPDLYRVRAGSCVTDAIIVTVVPPAAAGPPMPGPRRFTVSWRRGTCG